MTLLGIGIGLAQDRHVLYEVRKEVMLLENGAGDIWDYSGSGGYVFRFRQDVVGDGAAESFVNVSIRPNIWHVFTGSDSNNYVGDVTIAGSGFQLRRDSTSATIIRAYEAGAFEKYILEQTISSTGIQKSTRKVGAEATEKEYQAVLSRQTPDNTTWVAPKMEGILLYDLLNQAPPKWFEFNPDKAQVRNGYYRLPGDEDTISRFKNAFTPEVALRMLNHKLGISPVEAETVTTPSNQTHSTDAPPTTAPVQKHTPSPTPMVETKPIPSEFPLVLAILAAVIVGILIFIFRRKSS